MVDAIEEADIEVTDEMVEQRTEEFRQELRQVYGEDVDFDAFAAQQGMSPEDVQEMVAETVAIETLLARRGMEMPTTEDAREFYQENPDFFEQPESVEARHILISVTGTDEDAWQEARQQAEELHRRLTEEDADFAELAREYSDDGSAQQGGHLGRFGRGQMVPAFEETAFELEPGEISEPVQTSFGWHIIEVTEKHEGGVLDFDEVAEPLQRELRAMAMQEALDDLLVELRQNAEIELHPENIQGT